MKDLLRVLVREIINEYALMTTTPPMSWHNASYTMVDDDDPWGADASSPFEPAANTGSDKRVHELGDEEDVEPFKDQNEKGDELPLHGKSFWDAGYYSSPVMSKDSRRG